jgi:glycerol-3-phosphate dehydrogenase
MFILVDLTPKSACKTEDVLLIGSHGYNPRSYIQLIRTLLCRHGWTQNSEQFGMETEVAQHLVHNYGDRAIAVAALAANTNRTFYVNSI